MAWDGTAWATATPPLTADAHIAGHPIVDLWISSTTSDADVFVYLEDGGRHGVRVTHGRLRASHRGSPLPIATSLGLPYAAASELMPNHWLLAAIPYRLRLDMLPTSTIIKTGHRVRLTGQLVRVTRQRCAMLEFDPSAPDRPSNSITTARTSSSIIANRRHIYRQERRGE